MVMCVLLAVLCGIICESVVPVTGGYVSPWFYIQHWSSRKYVHPNCGGICPADGNRVTIHRDLWNNGKISFRFVQVEGHYGYIEQSCGKVIHSKDGNLYPGEEHPIDFHGDRHAGALFYFDEARNYIFHRGGKKWHPFGGSPNPTDGTNIVLCSMSGDHARFRAVSPSLTPVSVYGNPLVSGNWKRIFAVIDPKTSYQHQLTFTVGKSVTTSVTQNLAWSVSVEIAVKWFTASAALSGFVEKTEQSTWSEEVSRTTTIDVSPGDSIVVWQYMFGAEQFGEKLQFQSTILANTNNVNTPPNVQIN